MIKYLKERLQEPSTIRGFVWIAVACGVHIEPDKAQDIVAAGAALAGLIGALLPDK